MTIDEIRRRVLALVGSSWTDYYDTLPLPLSERIRGCALWASGGSDGYYLTTDERAELHTLADAAKELEP
jgi:hypothetical protein